MKFRRMCSSRSALLCGVRGPPSLSRLVSSGQPASRSPRYTPLSRSRPVLGSGWWGVTLSMRSPRLRTATSETDMSKDGCGGEGGEGGKRGGGGKGGKGGEGGEGGKRGEVGPPAGAPLCSPPSPPFP